MKISIPAAIACIHLNIVWRCYGSSSVRLSRITEYDGKTCSAADTLFTQMTGSMMECSVLCTQDEACAGVFHNTETGSCVGCSRTAFDQAERMTNEPGTACAYRCDKTDRWEDVGQKKYMLMDRPNEFIKGRILCRQLCADLVHLNSMEEQQLLNRWMNVGSNDLQFYIGLTDLETEGTFLWIDDGTEPVFTAWRSDEPNNVNGKQHAVVVVTGVWDDIDGTKPKFSVICEKR